MILDEAKSNLASAGVWPYSKDHQRNSSRKGRLLIIGPLPPPYAGPEIGTEIFLNSTALSLAFELGHINTTVRSSNSEKGRADLTMYVAYVIYVLRLVRALAFFRPHFVLYRPTSATLRGWVRDGTTLLLAPGLGAKVLVQFGGGHFRYFFDALGPISRRLIQGLLHRAAVVLPESRALKRQFAGIVPDARVRELPTSIPDDFFEFFDGCDRSNRPGPVTVLFVGHLSQAKGYCDVLKAIPFLAAKYDVKVRFMGVKQSIERNIFFNQATGERIPVVDPEQCYDEFIRKRGLEANVEFLGDQVFGKEKLEAFEAADIFVLPSYSEGFSRAILESMAAGLPAVVTSVGAVPDIVEDGGNAFVVRPGDVPGLQDRLERLIANPDLRVRMGAVSRQRCQERFRAEVVSEQLVGILMSA